MIAAVHEVVPKELKHIVLKEVHYQLMNTCLINYFIDWLALL